MLAMRWKVDYAAGAAGEVRDMPESVLGYGAASNFKGAEQ